MNKVATDQTLRAVIVFLQTKAAAGAMRQGREKAITNAIRKLRRALRTHDPRAISTAVDLVAKLFLSGI